MSNRRRVPMPKMVDPRLARILAHPARSHIMCITAVRPASPSQMALKHSFSTGVISYHCKVLLSLDCIEIVRVDPEARGGRNVETFYKAKMDHFFDLDTWNALGETAKCELIAQILGEMSDDLAKAILANTFLNPDDGHVSRTPMLVDQPLWDEVCVLLSETVERLIEIRDRGAGHLDPEDPEAMAIKVHMVQFRSPDVEKDTPATRSDH